MANLKRYLLETDRPRGVNLLIKTYDRNVTVQVSRRYLDVQIDYRDPNGRQGNPHLTSVAARDSQGRRRQNHAAAYGYPDFDTIEQYAGDNRQAIVNDRGEQIGTVYAVKAELVPSPHGDGGHFINISTLEPSDFEIDATTMTRQALSARLIRLGRAEDAEMIAEDKPSESAQHESLRTERRANEGTYRGAPTQAGISHEAGLETPYGLKSTAPLPPPPGAPGSRFNPVVRARNPEASIPERTDPRMISSHDVPKPIAKKLRAPTAQEISALGRISQSAAEGARDGARIGRAIPKVGPVVGGVVGGMVGAGHGFAREAEAKQAALKDDEVVEVAPPLNHFATAGARFGTQTASPGASARQRPSVKDSYDYRFKEAANEAESPHFG